MQAPWYYGATSATLRHQRQQEDQIPKFDSMNAWYKKGVKSVSYLTSAVKVIEI